MERESCDGRSLIPMIQVSEGQNARKTGLRWSRGPSGGIVCLSESRARPFVRMPPLCSVRDTRAAYCATSCSSTEGALAHGPYRTSGGTEQRRMNGNGWKVVAPLHQRYRTTPWSLHRTSWWSLVDSQVNLGTKLLPIGNIPSVPSNRRGHSAVLFNHVMHVYGGYMDLGGPSDEFWMLDLESGEWCLQRSAAGPGPRYEHAVALWQSRMFLHGGLQGMRASADLWACDLELKLWTRLTTRSGPGALHAHCACACVDGLLVFGGERKGCVLSEVWIFLHTGKVWTQLKLHPDMPKPQPRFQHTMATTANKPLVSHRVSAQMFTNRVFGMSDANNDLHGDFGQLEGETLPGMLLKTCKPLTIRHGSQEGTNHDESSDNLQSSLETVSPSCSVGLDHCVPDEFPVFVIGGGKSQTASSLMPEHIALGKLVLYLPIMH
uniref:uncharacterized protein isoform X3 n=1 Tax=Myxine glutinosa TaxID=7769 RepID=UPI00358E794A